LKVGSSASLYYTDLYIFCQKMTAREKYLKGAANALSNIAGTKKIADIV